MPELPEVETIKLELNQLIKHKKIKSVKINLAKQVKMPKTKFLKLVQDARIKKVSRRAKLLIVSLANDYHLIFHLKMSGQLIYRDRQGKLAGGGHPIKHNLQALPNKYSHIIFNFFDGSNLFFNDLRQFGWLKLVSGQQLEDLKNSYGPEPLQISFSQFEKLFKLKKSAIKPLLMDQKVIAGLGNIYAQEALFCAGILPIRPANEISQSELKKLYACIKKILKLAISKKGTSADSHVDAFGRDGSMLPYLKVYNRAGQKCRRCSNILKSIKQAQRTTCYCAICQK